MLSPPRLSQLISPGTRAVPTPTIQVPFRESLVVRSEGQRPLAVRSYKLGDGERWYAVTARLNARSLGEGDGARGDTPSAIPTFRESFVVQAAATSQPTKVLHWRGEPIWIDGGNGHGDSDVAAAPYVARWRALLGGRRAQLHIDTTGSLGEISFADDVLKQHSQPEIDELTQRLLAWLVPLPSQPIGVGARWTVVTVLRQSVGMVKQTASYQLLAITPTGMSVAIDVRRVAEEQRIATPTLTDGTSIDLVALFRQIKGRVEIDLTAPLPIAGDLTIEARSHQRIHRSDGTTTEAIAEDIGSLSLASTSNGTSDHRSSSDPTTQTAP
jgi:hypothetical protein